MITRQIPINASNLNVNISMKFTIKQSRFYLPIIDILKCKLCRRAKSDDVREENKSKKKLCKFTCALRIHMCIFEKLQILLELNSTITVLILLPCIHTLCPTNRVLFTFSGISLEIRQHYNYIQLTLPSVRF